MIEQSSILYTINNEIKKDISDILGVGISIDIFFTVVQKRNSGFCYFGNKLIQDHQNL